VKILIRLAQNRLNSMLGISRPIVAMNKDSQFFQKVNRARRDFDPRTMR